METPYRVKIGWSFGTCPVRHFFGFSASKLLGQLQSLCFSRISSLLRCVEVAVFGLERYEGT